MMKIEATTSLPAVDRLNADRLERCTRVPIFEVSVWSKAKVVRITQNDLYRPCLSLWNSLGWVAGGVQVLPGWYIVDS